MESALGAMTGALPVVVVAGAATMMTKGLFQRAPQPARRKRRKSSKSRKSGPNNTLASRWGGDFSNVGL